MIVKVWLHNTEFQVWLNPYNSPDRVDYLVGSFVTIWTIIWLSVPAIETIVWKQL